MAADVDALHVERNNLSGLLPFRYYRLENMFSEFLKCITICYSDRGI